MAEAWKKLKDKVKAKRTKTSLPETQRRPKGEELTVQRLSAQVSGKAQKYSRMGPREFVPFPDEMDFNLENIKSACVKYFSPSIGKDVVCDVLAAEQGPSCKSVSQIPDLKVVYVRFIPACSSSTNITSSHGDPMSMKNDKAHNKRKADNDTDDLVVTFDGKVSHSKIKSSPSKFLRPGEGMSPAAASKCVPKSLSISDMIKLGKLNKSTVTTLITLYQFNMEILAWSKVPITVEFLEEKNILGSGGFRKAFKATSQHKDFRNASWVIKRYHPEALQCISDTGQTPEEHNRKVVQMHLLARNFAMQLKEQITKSCESTNVFGDFLKYRKIFHGETDQNEYVTVEEFIPGDFTKYINNTGLICADPSDVIGQKAECLTHFSYHKTDKQLMLVDIQGNGHDLFDPEIASTELVDDEKNYLYCTGNLSDMAISTFIREHKCNKFCALAELPPLQK